jgi:signal transduction histidine kinase
VSVALPFNQIAMLMHQIAVAPSLADAIDRMQLLLRDILPAGSRTDLLCRDEERAYLLYSSLGGYVPAIRQPLTAFQQEVVSEGYRSLVTLPLDGPHAQVGWLLIAHPLDALDAERLAQIQQVAALLAVRLEYEQCRSDLADREERMRALSQRLQTADEVRLRATLAAGAAHDIGNLFASVMGHVQLIQQQAPVGLLADLRTVEQAARDGHHLLRRVLSSRIETSAIAYRPIADVAQSMEDAIRLTQPFWDGQPPIAVTSDTIGKPAAAIYPPDLREVLINLIMNGVAAMQEGGVLSLRAEERDGAVAIHVSDTGIGIDPNLQLSIFQPSGSKRGGVGLGLSTSRAVLEEYGGTIEVASAVGEGTTFMVSLPVAPPDVA